DWEGQRLENRLSSLALRLLKAVRRAFSRERSIGGLDDRVEECRRTLHAAVRSFLEQSAEELNARVLRKDGAFVFFRRLLNPDPAKACAVKLLHDVHVDYWAVDSQLECYPDHLRFDGYFIKTLTMKHLPSHSFANMFADLSHVKSDMVVATEWRM